MNLNSKTDNDSSGRTYLIDKTAYMGAVYNCYGIRDSRQKDASTQLGISRNTEAKFRNGGVVSERTISKVAHVLKTAAIHLVAAVDKQRFLRETGSATAEADSPYEIQTSSSLNSTSNAQVVAEPVSSWQLALPAKCQTEYFVRDQDLAQIKELMQLTGDPERARDVQFLTSLHGFPGIGKSELAVHLARDPDVISTFRNGVIWHECEPKKSKSSENSRARERLLIDLCRRLSGEEIGYLALIDQMQAELRRVLKDRSVLFVFDDVWDGEMLQLIKEILPSHCSILVTTPVPSAFDERADERVRIYDVPELTEENARRLFLALFQKSAQEAPTAAITRQVLPKTGYLPAAIIVAARTMVLQRRRGLSDRRIVNDISSALQKNHFPRVALSSGGRSLSEVLVWVLEAVSEPTRQALSQLTLLGTKSSTLRESDLECVWAEETKQVIDDLCDVGLLRVYSGKNQNDREFGINHFVYELAGQLQP